MAAKTQGDLEWKPEYDLLLEQIATTDSTDTDWTLLRGIIQFRISKNINLFLSNQVEHQEHDYVRTPEQLPRSSPISLPSSSPSQFPPSPISSVVHQGLVLPPFPKRERRRDGPIRVHNNIMDEKEANELKNQIFEQLDEFDNSPPFTIQRLCELCIRPRKHYKMVGKYLRAVERTILVTSTRDAYPSTVGDGDSEMTSTFGHMEALRLASTPLMSPIPFLHNDARRSRSPSPFELAATRRMDSLDELDHPSAEQPSVRRPLGLVDELDDPKPGHLADHPTALTSVTSTEIRPAPLLLSERFVKSSSPEPEGGSRDISETVESRQAEDAEVEDMVLDDSTLEDEDKENRPS